MRFLALDFGEKRIGAAVSDPLNLTAQPLSFIPHTQTMWEDIRRICKDYQVSAIVVGLPRNLNGSDSAKTMEARRFALQVKDETGLPVTHYDERLSTKAVTRTLIDANLSRQKRKKVTDSAAAAFFLQGFLDKYQQSGGHYERETGL